MQRCYMASHGWRTKQSGETESPTNDRRDGEEVNTMAADAMLKIRLLKNKLRKSGRRFKESGRLREWYRKLDKEYK